MGSIWGKKPLLLLEKPRLRPKTLLGWQMRNLQNTCPSNLFLFVGNRFVGNDTNIRLYNSLTDPITMQIHL